MLRFLSAWFGALIPAAVWAHPGHGVTDPQTAAHYVFEPLHGVPVLLAIGVAVVVAHRRRAARRG